MRATLPEARRSIRGVFPWDITSQSMYMRWGWKGQRGRLQSCVSQFSSACWVTWRHFLSGLWEPEQSCQGTANLPLSKALLTCSKWMLTKPPYLRLKPLVLDLQKHDRWACASTLSAPSATIANTFLQALISSPLVGMGWVQSWSLIFYPLLGLGWSQNTGDIIFIPHYNYCKRENLSTRNRDKPWIYDRAEVCNINDFHSAGEIYYSAELQECNTKSTGAILVWCLWPQHQ